MSQDNQREYMYPNNQLEDKFLYPEINEIDSDSSTTITQSRYDNNNNSSADFHQNPQRKFNFHIIYIGSIFLLFIFIRILEGIK